MNYDESEANLTTYLAGRGWGGKAGTSAGGGKGGSVSLISQKKASGVPKGET